MTVFQIKAIKPGRLKVDAIRLELLNALRREGREAERDLEKCVATWNNPPDFRSEISLAGGDAVLITGATGNGEAVQHFMYVDKGTRIRWALMSSDWQSKTRPGSLRSGRGGGRVIVAGKRYMQAHGIAPRPGIEARNFTDTIQKQRRQRFHRAMIAAIQSGALKVWGK